MFLWALYMGLLYPWYVIMVPMSNVHLYFSLKNLDKRVCITHAKYGLKVSGIELCPPKMCMLKS